MQHQLLWGIQDSMQQKHQCMESGCARALVAHTLGEVPGPSSLVHLHCNYKAKDQMDAGGMCIGEHINHIPPMLKRDEGVSLRHPLENETLCLWSLGVGAGICLKEWKVLSFKQNLKMKKLRIAASLNDMWLATGHLAPLHILIYRNGNGRKWC